MVLLRGFASLPSWPKLPEVTAMRAAAIAGYPMYRGIGALLGMTVVASEEPPADKMRTLARVWDEHDFFFVHIKKTDSAGEDGDFERKVKMVEEVDRSIPALMDLKPDVVVVTGDHSTPARLRSHSWHPVPVLLRADSCRPDGVGGFGERECASGSLGASLPGCALLPLALAHAHRLQKFGA
jgi:2,3-bisphosphoglycerate-independent phosphoglycerate mutase